VRPEIVEYRSEWPARFEQIAGRLHASLGPPALRIDHIGSTSIPGLCAKDVIDVQVTVESLDVDVLTSAFQRAGFVRRADIVRDHVPPGKDESGEEWTKLYFVPEDAEDSVHVRVAGRANQRYPLLFRDYLRGHPDAADAYGELKRRLAPLCEDTGVYADAKDPACDIVMSAAEEWAERTGWGT
jgi:GrpB-like predicted nucleotidyltransferase (UPF0157 family)